LVLDDCWSAVAPLVTLCEPLPMFTPGLTSAPMLALEFATPTLAFTPTFGFTLSEREVSVLFVDSLFVVSLVLLLVALSDALGVDEADPLRLEDEELEGFDDWLPLALRSVELEELLLEGFVVEAEPFRFVVLEELLEGDWVVFEFAPFTFTSVELDELLEGDCVDPAPFRLMSVELEELEGVEAVPEPFRLMSVELEELPPGTVVVEPFTPVLMSVCEEEVAPGTTATPGPRSVVVVVLLPALASGTLGMQPAGCELAASMHFGAASGMLTVIVSARAAP